jgi:acyl-coenzyme A thioesterase PaaI-like protein
VANFTLQAWQRLSSKPGGKWLFSRFVCFKAPYFASIRPRFIELRPGRSEVFARKRRAVTNHIGTFHAIAMCNMAELAGGTLTDVSIPLTHRRIPKGMTVEYLKKAETDLRAVAELPAAIRWTDAQELPVTVNVLNTSGEAVFRAVIRMWVTRKGAGS